MFHCIFDGLLRLIERKVACLRTKYNILRFINDNIDTLLVEPAIPLELNKNNNYYYEVVMRVICIST